MRHSLSCLLIAALILPGCGSSRGTLRPGQASPAAAAADVTVMADYVRQLPVGSTIRLSRRGGRDIIGILMKGDSDPLIVQRRTRIPEPPVAIPLAVVTAVEPLAPASGQNLTKAIAVGAATGAGAFLGIFLFLAVILADS